MYKIQTNRVFQQCNTVKISETYIGVCLMVYCVLAKDVKPCKQITLKSNPNVDESNIFSELKNNFFLYKLIIYDRAMASKVY
ncbi:14348_t:CDS:2 [Dentiscutata erythropus]|uniref:14348_t:CDS:1 n=1 Tax=Dentiscutata erythropus TaxID=1348616 RepID=A0A9N8YSH4_9GLOM|nr:14348_t:CDS:2 [Dentiscutata erythropus]